MLKALVGITDNSDSPFADIQGLDSLKIKLKITEWLTFDDYIDKNTGLIKQPN
jgi:hypothetical protein